MKKLVSICILFVAILASCKTEGAFTSDPKQNFDQLWETLDARYCYFNEKLPQGKTWRDMYDKHVKSIYPKMTEDSLFTVMGNLLAELKDGHVNLYSPFNVTRYWAWRDEYPSNYNSAIVSKYLGTNYKIAAGALYQTLTYNNHAKDSIGYIRYSSFSSPLSHSNVNAMLMRFAKCRALIIDIRENGGGNLTTSDMLYQHFLPERTMIGYISHKTGPAHDAFSKPLPIYVDTLRQGVKWFRPVVVLTDRGVYSAANDFVMKMKPLKLVLTLGDKSGGGAGLPASSELPNGWGIRYSASRMTDPNGQSVEFGIEPEAKVLLSQDDESKNLDTLIETAIKHINDFYDKLKKDNKGAARSIEEDDSGNVKLTLYQ